MRTVASSDFHPVSGKMLGARLPGILLVWDKYIPESYKHLDSLVKKFTVMETTRAPCFLGVKECPMYYLVNSAGIVLYEIKGGKVDAPLELLLDSVERFKKFI